MPTRKVKSMMITESQPLLVTNGLTKRFGGIVAVNNVSMQVKPGELRCLIGPNGAGKSTFFKCLTGQIKPSAGTIEFGENQLAGEHTHDIVSKGVGIKTQTPSLFDGLSAHENISLAARRHHSQQESVQVTDEMLELMGITCLAKSEVGILAHGQRQLVELAMVLAGKPQLVLLDEPAAGMTGEERLRLAQILHDLSGRISLIVVEHDMHFIGDIAAIVTVFHRGAVFTEGSFSEVMANQNVQDIYLGKEAQTDA